MKNIKQRQLFYLFLMIPFFFLGQKDFRNGYIISIEGDTIIGLVKDRKEPPFGKLYEKIIFKKGSKKKKIRTR